MPRPRVKICGITTSRDAQLAARLGADAIGLVFFPGSPRAVTVSQASEIVNRLPAFTTVVGLLVDPHERQVQEVLETGLIDCLQFHGSESPEFCESFGVPFIKAIAVKDLAFVEEQLGRFEGSCSVILDTYHKDKAGGTGQQFDWAIARTLVEEGYEQIILAGGLHVENVADAIRQVNPYGVDVSSGVELSPGVKDQEKLQNFFHAVESVRQIEV